MAKHTQTTESRVPGWIWLLTGTLLGALIMFLMRLSELQPPGQPHASGKLTEVKDAIENKTPSFEFYRLLRDSEVTVPERPDRQPSIQPKENVSYVLQVASFRSLADAEQVRAELTLLNLAARVERADGSQGETWHRVMVGPFDSRSQLANARNTLLSNRYEALLLTRRNPG